MSTSPSTCRAIPRRWRWAPTAWRAASPKKPRKRGLDVQLVRNGSRGLFWLEPLVEVATPAGPRRLRPGRGRRRGRPVRRRLPAAVARTRCASASTDQIPYLAEAGAPDLRAHGHHRPAVARRLRSARRLRRPARRAGAGAAKPSCSRCSTPACAAAAARPSRPASSGRRCCGTQAAQKYIVCNADEGDSGTYLRPHDDGGRPVHADRRHDDRGLAVGATQGYVYIRCEYPHAIATLNEAIAPRRTAQAFWATTCSARASASRWRCARARARTCAAKRPRCSKAWKASAASCAPSRRCRPSRACSASRRVINNVITLRQRAARSWRAAPRSTATSAWAARAARCRSSWPATSNTAAWSRRPSA